VPTTPPGNEVVVIEGTAVTVMMIDAVVDGLATSVALTVAVVSSRPGVLYVTDVDVALESVPGPLRLQVTPPGLLVIAVIVMLWPSSMAGAEEPAPNKVSSEAKKEPEVVQAGINAAANKQTHSRARFIAYSP